jgi:hypothetical protein
MHIRFVQEQICPDSQTDFRYSQVFAGRKWVRSAITRAGTRREVCTAVGGGLLGGAGSRIFYSGNAQELIQNEYPYLK